MLGKWGENGMFGHKKIPQESPPGIPLWRCAQTTLILRYPGKGGSGRQRTTKSKAKAFGWGWGRGENPQNGSKISSQACFKKTTDFRSIPKMALGVRGSGTSGGGGGGGLKEDCSWPKDTFGGAKDVLFGPWENILTAVYFDWLGELDRANLARLSRENGTRYVGSVREIGPFSAVQSSTMQSLPPWN